MENKQPVVYVARNVKFYNGLGDVQDVACYVSKAHLQESFIKYFENGDIDKEYLVGFDYIPQISLLTDYAGFDAGSERVDRVAEVFSDYKTCKEYVNEINRKLAQNIPNVPSDLEDKKYSIHKLAKKYAHQLEEDFISSKERIGEVKPYGIKYLVSFHPADEELGLPAETAGVLDVVNMLTDKVFWFDNDTMEWQQSIYSAKTMMQGIGTEYEEFDSFDNGYVNTGEIWESAGRLSLVARYPDEFARNLDIQKELEF